MESSVGLSVKKVKVRCGEFHLRFCGSPSCLSGHQLFIYCMIGVNSLFIEFVNMT